MTYKPPFWLPQVWPATATDEDLDSIDPHRLIVKGLTDTQAADRIAWHQAKVNTAKTTAAELDAPHLQRDIAHHETVIRAVLAQHHQKRKGKKR